MTVAQARRVGGGGGGGFNPLKFFKSAFLGVEKIKIFYTKQSKDCDWSITRTTTFLARIIGGSRNILAL